MAVGGCRLLPLLGAAALSLALPACSARPTVPSPDDLPPQPATPNLPALPPAVPAGPLSLADPPGGQGPPPEAAQGEEGAQAAAPWDRLRLDFDLAREDYGHYYSAPNLTLLALGIGAAAPLANTPADRTIDRWYQERVRRKELDGVATATAYAATFWWVVPAGLEAAALSGKAGEGWASDGGLFEWSNRSLRAAAVGFPPVLASMVVLGSSRPGPEGSGWHPFEDDHGVSGHTFAGAVPFLTAAAMTDNPFWKVPLVLGSFLAGWARIHEDQHYFSQVVLGWWMAYLAVRSVNETQAGRRSYSIGPAIGPAGPGVVFQVRY